MGSGRAARPSPFARLSGRLLTMSVFYNIMLGYFFGFALGVDRLHIALMGEERGTGASL